MVEEQLCLISFFAKTKACKFIFVQSLIAYLFDQLNLFMQISRQLLLDCKRKDRKAQFALYKSCFQVLMRVCVRYKRNEDEAAAVLNEGFLKILNNLDKYDEKAPFEAWIKRIMINTIIDEFRKNRKVKELVEYTNFEEEERYAEQYDMNTADQIFDAADIEAMIQTLPPVTQKVFNLYAVDGFTHKDIGNMLDISDGTSKWHLSSARKKLKEMMLKKTNASRMHR